MALIKFNFHVKLTSPQSIAVQLLYRREQQIQQIQNTHNKASINLLIVPIKQYNTLKLYELHQYNPWKIFIDDLKYGIGFLGVPDWDLCIFCSLSRRQNKEKKIP